MFVGFGKSIATRAAADRPNRKRAQAIIDDLKRSTPEGQRKLRAWRDRQEAERRWAAGRDTQRLELVIKGAIGPGATRKSVCEEAVLATIDAHRYAREIYCWIDSPGGRSISGERIHHRIRAHPAQRKICRVTGQCSSAAIDILLAFDERVAAANSTLLIHRAEVGPEKVKRSDRWTAARWNSFVAWLERHDREMVERYHERTGAPRAWLEREIRNENSMTASEALRRGFLTRVNEKLEVDLRR